MSYKVVVTRHFSKEVKRLVKKYLLLKEDLSHLITTLESNPFQGTSLGKNCYKIRLAISSKGQGKSGGARVITHVYVSNKTVYLLAIYDKVEKETITNKELKDLLGNLKEKN